MNPMKSDVRKIHFEWVYSRNVENWELLSRERDLLEVGTALEELVLFI
jgi:hypothetical protein